MWASSRRDHEVARATQEARAGRTARALRLIFPEMGGGTVDNAFWQETEVTDEKGNTEKEWHFITDPEAVANKALEQVQALFPSPLGWRPELTDAVFPSDYAFAGHKVTSPELGEIPNNTDKVDLTDVLVPMVLEDLDALLRRHTKDSDSAPGISGVTYGHLRAMSPKHRQVCLQMTNRFIQYQHSQLDASLVPLEFSHVVQTRSVASLRRLCMRPDPQPTCRFQLVNLFGGRLARRG